jgi:MOSC domain-containing protein YiiM
VSGVREDQVCLGDVFTVDTRIVQVFKARDEFHE